LLENAVKPLFPFAFAATLIVSSAAAQQIPLTQLARARLRSSTAATTEYKGSPAFHIIPVPRGAPGYANRGAMAVLDSVHFHNGAIDVDVAGQPQNGADESARGFIGVVFRVHPNDALEIFYLRPTNSHADDQLRRNHTVQYASDPDWPWERLRKQTPGVYESWVDIQTAEWTHMRIVVHGTDAKLYVNHAEIPCLIVHDLKLGDSEGAVGLWIGTDTDGYFRNLQIKSE
jgi:hypothetical protein